MDGGPSRTALLTAHARAVHQSEDRPLILNDPLAQRIVSCCAAEIASSDAAVQRDRRLFFATRARFAQDRVAVVFRAGCRQVVVLGAGLDTFAYRNPHAGLRVFEIDHPATQKWKRDTLRNAGIDVPESMTFVPVDFETQDLGKELNAAGFDRSESAIFVWLGVVYYLTERAVFDTLEYVVGQTAAVELVFDYLQPGANEVQRAEMHDRGARLARVGEPLRSYFSVHDVDARLRGLGFTVLEDRGAAELIEGYLEQSCSPDRQFASLWSNRLLRAGRC